MIGGYTGAAIFIAPRRTGDGRRLAQGKSHILVSDSELRMLATHIAEHLCTGDKPDHGLGRPEVE
jgi:hypothetical protein